MVNEEKSDHLHAEKHIERDEDRTLSPLRPVVTGSTIEHAIDAEANIIPQQPDSQPSPKDDEWVVAPDGGFKAWLQVAGSFFLFFNSWGTVNAFGVFQTYYENNPLWTASPSNISWIGSIQAFLLLTVGVVTGPVFDSGYFRHLIIAGAILTPFGFMMTSLCTNYWQTMLAQAFCIGIGNGLMFVPSVAILPQYFSRHKALANGIAASGSSFGGIIYPIVFRRLEQSIGFGWATRILGFISLFTVGFSVFVMKPLYLPKTRRKMHELAAFKEPPYLLFCMSSLIAFVGMFGPIYYISLNAITTGITDESFGFYLLPILNAASIAGRIVPNFLADITGPLNILVPASMLTGGLALAWIGITNLSGTIVFAVVYGFFSGSFVSLPPIAIVTLTPDLRTLGTRMGQCFFLSSFGLLIGTPISGVILQTTGSWTAVKIFSGVAIFITGALMLWARFYVVGWNLRVRA